MSTFASMYRGVADRAGATKKDKDKCRGCGSMEFQHCEKGLVCSYCRAVIEPARKPGAYARMPYIALDTPAPGSPAPDREKYGLTMEQALTKFRQLGRFI